MWVGVIARRRIRRVKYEPIMVAQRVLSNQLYLAIVKVLLESNTPMQAGEIRKELLKQGINISVGYVSNILRKLEKWGLARPYKNPVNGRLLWTIRESSKAVEIIVEELKKRETKIIFKIWGINQ